MMVAVVVVAVVVVVQVVVQLVLVVVVVSVVVMVFSVVVVVPHEFVDLGRVANIIDSICTSQTFSVGMALPFVFARL